MKELKGNSKQTEKCVLCKKDTGVAKDLHIDYRKNYVPGCGQVCDDCIKKIDF